MLIKKTKKNKRKKTKDYLKTRVELKLFERKLDFLDLFENWSPEDYLKIRVLGVKFNNWNSWRLNLREIRILKNCLRNTNYEN